MMNQICIAGVVQGLAESLSISAKKAGMDIEAVIDVISKGAAHLGRWKIATRA